VEWKGEGCRSVPEPASTYGAQRGSRNGRSTAEGLPGGWWSKPAC